ncbi:MULTISPECIES: pyrroline-5-carboxylate reductase [unclassified Hydrogenobaculum]|jgi:pyrroline-5-carboxylate reductase|uniref:pyrroline-5-carboxylate reductase n=1 Tax=unclassified Hydrogenobaculum TaxID=2622382 RepID=UPI0001C50A8C|nr:MULTISPECIES: pyrroline-5-carboxylate reductase [unclassified Hydrogenobaculum]AEF19165.1 pyrroline-5-carboxylate reductase [Hydrogenobaculum sp. 3684]AEG46454.1 pyrroline-5-carboxylate reductase [Hydrogenobaculum sp. SHO]AGG15098.1 pyrroline-5-carboxylate reductase [Hydrogenobaculum sp. HO]AGH93394.1 pyrroline-5-carboxylate reductase [Hydrogenobaculum sp. SN]
MRIGIIGYGNMGRAFALGLKDHYDIIVFDKDTSKKELALQDGIGFSNSIEFLLDSVDLIILSIKPQDLASLKELNFNGKSLVSMLAGTSVSRLKEHIKDAYITRIMPNLAVIYKKGVIGFYSEDAKKEVIKSMLEHLGKVYELEEKYFDAFTAIGGSGPAFVASIVEAMRLSGIYMGLNKDVSYDLAMATIEGTLELLKAYNEEELILKVSSPAGTTIEGIYNIEKTGLKGILMETFIRAYQKSKSL